MLALKIYRLMLKFYPATFRENYAGPLEREFLDEYGEAPTRLAVAWLWIRTLRDFCTSVPLMLAREFKEDARHAVRQWTKRPLPVAMAIVALAIGVGANIGAFSVIEALMLRSLPFKEPERLVAFQDGFVPIGFDGTANRFHQWFTQSRYLESAVQYAAMEVNLADGERPARVQLTETAANFFELMGTRPRAGRGFAAGDDEPGQDGVAVIGYGLWQQMFGGERRALGAKIYLNGTPVEVIGVAPPGFDYPEKSEVWTPTVFDVDRIAKGSVTFLRTVGRVKKGLTLAQARSAFEAEALANAAKDWSRSALIPLRDKLAGPLKHESLILSVAVGLLLLIACASVANLLLSRTAERVNEMAIRTALGASRARLIQQLFTESLVLSAVGALASLVVAQWAVKMAAVFQPAGLSSQNYTLVNWRVLAFAVGLGLVTGLLFGAAPAMFAGSSLVRSNAPRPFTSRLRSILVSVQIALTVVLICGATSLGQAFIKLMSTDNGFETRNVVSLKVSLSGPRYDGEPRNEYYRESVRRIRALGGVVSASASLFLPLGTSAYNAARFKVDDQGTESMAIVLPVAAGFFATIGSQVIGGRTFVEADERYHAEKLVVVSESFASTYVEDPRSVVGRRVTSKSPWGPARIVGVVRDMHFNGPGSVGEVQVFPLMTGATKFVIRVNGDPHKRLAAIRHAVQSVDPQIPVFDVMTMDERLAEVTARPRFYTLATVLFGGCALLLSIVGLYGMISYSVAQRTREMGIRMALGSTAGALRVMMLRQGLVLVTIGSVPGVIVALFVGAWLEQLVLGSQSVISVMCLASVVLIATVAALSAWTATSRIANLDPSAALRVE